MIWKTFVGPHAITSRRRVVASAVMYGLSLTVRFTSAAGDETETASRANPMLSILLNDGAEISNQDWLPKLPQPVLFHRGWPLGPKRCRAACEGPVTMSSVSNCPP